MIILYAIIGWFFIGLLNILIVTPTCLKIASTFFHRNERLDNKLATIIFYGGPIFFVIIPVITFYEVIKEKLVSTVNDIWRLK